MNGREMNRKRRKISLGRDSRVQGRSKCMSNIQPCLCINKQMATYARQSRGCNEKEQRKLRNNQAECI